MDAIAAEIADGNILRLIEKFLRSGVIENGVFKPTKIGTPQGGLCKALHNPPYAKLEIMQSNQKILCKFNIST
jgi:retron-type reverse transcriptase